MKYKVGAFKHDDGRWEAKYIEPEGKLLAGGVVQIPNSFLLRKYFSTKKEANDYAINFLIKKGVEEKDIEIKE